ncbi:MAG: hypothetical protein LBV53_02040 [Mycoplasmataceae bacterium]|jgi:negative regulator of replication initiation|nr:hypothetical protein [Mycoplasmataceae bacterium]
MKHIEGKNLKINNDRTFSCDIIKKKKMSPAKTVSKNAKPKQPSNRNKYVTEERFQEAITSIRRDMVTEERFQEAITSIRRDMVTHEELHRVVHQVVNDAINSLEERMTKLILSLKK